MEGWRRGWRRCHGPSVPRKITHEGGEGGRKDGSGEKGGGETEKQVRKTEVNIWRSLVRSRKQQLEDGSSMLAWGGWRGRLTKTTGDDVRQEVTRLLSHEAAQQP